MDLWQILEIAGAAVGLVYIWLEYRADVWLWLAGIVMPAIYIYVYYRSGLYADMGISVYYLLAGVYGWAVWLGRSLRKRGGGGKPLHVSHTPRRVWLPATLAGAAFFAAIAWVLVRFTDSTVPYCDAFTTALSIVALWMLARKYAEQWLVWIVVDAVSSGLYVYKELYPTAALYALYSVIAVFGYIKWTKMISDQ